MKDNYWEEDDSLPVNRSPLPKPDHPGVGLDSGKFTAQQKLDYQRLMYGFTRLLAWQAELLNRQNEEDNRVYCEELEAWRAKVKAFRKLVLQM